MDESSTKGTWRQYVRIRVSLDINKPLKRRMKIKRENGTFTWINFKYERLSTFCFVCGHLGHSDRDCEIVYANPLKMIERAYGVWLRAPSKSAQKQNVRSKWLRNGPNGGYNSSSEGHGTAITTMYGGEGSTMNFMETDGVVSEKVGGEVAITFKKHNLGDTLVIGDRLNPDNLDRLEAGNREFENEIVVVDSKRKRIEVEKLQEDKRGNNTDVVMGPIDVSKNGPEAGLGFQARLGQ